MALFHFHIPQVKRSAGQSIVTYAAYRSGEKLYSEYYGEVSDYTHKGGVVCTDILLPPQAPAEYQDRATLWNAVEKAERSKKAQLAYSFDIALQNGFRLRQNVSHGIIKSNQGEVSGVWRKSGISIALWAVFSWGY